MFHPTLLWREFRQGQLVQYNNMTDQTRTLILPVLKSVRKTLGKAKRWLIKMALDAKHFGRQAQRMLRSDYPELLFDIALEERFGQSPFPPLRHLATNEGFLLLAIEDLQIHWPHNYETTGIGWIYREVFAAPEINPHAYEFDNAHMVPGSWVIDAGASEGFFVHYALRRGCKVIAIEPVPAFVRALELTFRHEIEAGNVRIVEGAIGDSSGTLWLTLGESDVFSSRVEYTQGNLSVNVYTLDELITEQGISDVSFVKMDIEGAELHVLEGARNILRHQRPVLSIAVYHEQDTALILKGLLKRIAPDYKVRFRGAWLRNSDKPRPYMLMASPK